MSSQLTLNETSTSKAEVLLITRNGILISLPGGEYFMSFAKFPWFRDARISDVLNVEFDGEDLRWNALDVDLHMESITNTKNNH